ncbi:uncharacterized protein EI90DRAFT_3017401 [Cantharellus anzutake]|uniref:uncharacterized protein n=1 Tax=Cantharellus anzutake TaxID=1750568 RepID=UPI00190335F0|nr:uncharacterized protein EI90DRAFT_3017401 [Cantharellus anzutake]KAF8329166.1 hypothetical protein EI90DRAFT_3017401 [Cantharellus anzutake]
MTNSSAAGIRRPLPPADVIITEQRLTGLSHSKTLRSRYTASCGPEPEAHAEPWPPAPLAGSGGPDDGSTGDPTHPHLLPLPPHGANNWTLDCAFSNICYRTNSLQAKHELEQTGLSGFVVEGPGSHGTKNGPFHQQSLVQTTPARSIQDEGRFDHGIIVPPV